MSGRLYIVPTPVGNLDDMTFRAVNVLKEADLILADGERPLPEALIPERGGNQTDRRRYSKGQKHLQALFVEQAGVLPGMSRKPRDEAG